MNQNSWPWLTGDASAETPRLMSANEPSAPVVLVIDDDRSILHSIRRAFRQSDWIVVTATTAHEGLALVADRSPDAVLLDIVLPELSGFEVFDQIRQRDSRLPVIFITSCATSQMAIEAMMRGAYDFLFKPLEIADVQKRVQQAVETRRLMRLPVEISTNGPSPGSPDPLIGQCPQMLDVYKILGKVARRDVTVLIQGENGTGKELVARTIRHHSRRAGQPFLTINCTATPEALLERELFGQEAEASNGAETPRIGKVEACRGGTIFVDEIASLSPLLQYQLLRLLDEQTFQRCGGTQTIAADVRIMIATNQNLRQLVKAGCFREDLFHRLQDCVIELPPLRERGQDIWLLLQHFLSCFSLQDSQPSVEGVAPETVDLLMRHPWPGNVRELQSVVRQALLNTTGPVLVPECLPPEIRLGQASPRHAIPNSLPIYDLRKFVDQRLQAGSTNLYAEALEVMERYVVTRVLNATTGNQTKAAQILGITRGKIRNRMALFGISLEQVVHSQSH